MLEQMADLVREEKPDAFLLSGDVFHTDQPSAAVQRMLADDLLAVWSHHEPAVVADDVTRRALWLQDDQGQWQVTSLFELCAALPAAPRATFIDDRIFSADLLANVVMPSLRDACLMQFAATDRIRQTGS